MYLEKLELDGFRSFERIKIPLCKDLTIFVGENNGGKSNAIDAIRLLTSPLNGRREIYCEPTDVRFGSANRTFEIAGTFAALDPGQQGRLITAATDSQISGCSFGLRYEEIGDRIPGRTHFWAGLHRLLLTEYAGARIADRVVVVTDGDNGIVDAKGGTLGQNRKEALEKTASDLNATDWLNVVINDYSLEPALVAAGNGELMKQLYLELHPKSEEKWDAAVALNGSGQAEAIQQIFKDVRKGDYAQLLAEAIQKDGQAFNVPAYLEMAILQLTV